MDLLTIENFIGGKFIQHDGLYIDSYDPSTGDVWARVPESNESIVEKAFQAASDAFTTWSVTPVKERSAILMKIADIIESRLDEFAKIESRDQGKPVSLAKRVDIPRAILNFRFFATSILHHLDISEYMDDRDALNYTTRSPVGVAGLIAPWNLPLYLLTFKIAPAIATGNTVVAKPSEMTSATSWMLCDVFSNAGLPPGVVNVVFGTGQAVGDAIVRHPRIPLISFTGSTLTAQRIRTSSSQYCKKLSLELGGKNPAVVFADADLETCIPGLVRASFTNQGEVCLSSSRLFVHSDIYQEFLAKFLAATRAIKVGDPRAMDTNMGALISKEHLEKVTGYINIAKEEGATIHCGHGVDSLQLREVNRKGYFILPTVITDVSDSSRLMQEEIFGPVVCIVPFRDPDEVVARANNCQYGLSATIWTKDLSTTHKIARQLQVGTVWVNCWLERSLNMPFGGAKASGTGREGLHESIDFYTEVKTVCIKL